MIIPDRDCAADVYPGERETVIIDNKLGSLGIAVIPPHMWGA